MLMQSIPKTVLSLMWYFIKPQFWRFLILITTMLGWSVQESVYPYFIKLFIDQITKNSLNKSNIFLVMAPTLLTFISMWLIIELGFRTYDFLSIKTFPQFRANIRSAIFQYTTQHSYQYYSDNFAGSIANKISRLPDALENIVIITFTIIFPVLAAFIINIILLYTANPLFAGIMGGWLIFHCFITYIFTRKCAVYSHQHSSTITSLNGTIVDILTNIVNVRLFSNNSFEKLYLAKFQEEELRKSYKLMGYNALMKLFLGLASQTFIFSMIGGGIYAWRENWITLGELTLVLSSINLIGLAWYMGMHLIKVYEHIGTSQEALSIVQRPIDIIDVPNAKPITIITGEIQFKDVTFHYNKGKKIFKNKNIIIHSGEKVGLVGFSGSGKTTFVNLILRYFDVEQGQILIDGQDIKMVTQDSLRKQIALIPQDTSLFHRNLLENIRYGRLDASDDEVITASKKAHCHEFIEQLEQQYQTLVGERGIKLSGGQRQRIAIARAILKNAPILILDEATSSLDSVTEKYIQASLKQLMANRSTIVIAHRLSTLSDMDRIVVFHNGAIVEDGKQEDLIKQDGHYASLWKMQAGGFLADTSA
jgi:ATP-binding cassette subfamily B protein